MKNLTYLSIIAVFLNINALFGNDTITLDLSNPTNPAEFTLDAEKGYWTETYNTAETYRYIEFDLFRLTHILNGFGGTDVGGGMSYWDGFTYCTSGDTNNYGEVGSSDGWVANQWGCMAGGGIKTDENGVVMTGENGKVLVEKAIPYLVAYWGYWIETIDAGDPCLQITFTDDNQYQPVGIYINNHPWPYYGNIYGDGFARPFDEGDYFKLYIHGLNKEGEDIGIVVEYTLAEFKNGKLQQSPDWEWVDLSALGTVSGIYFTMETTDADRIFGPNTAVYFCLDKLQVRLPQETTAPTRPTGLQNIAYETAIEFSWNASTGTAGVKGYNLYLDNVFTAFVSDRQYNFTGLQPYTRYLLTVEAVANDNMSSEKASLSVQTTDETSPTMPVNLQGTATQYAITLSWEASTDNVAVTEYHIYLDGERQRRVYALEHTLTGLNPETTYFVEVEARDAAGNRSERSSILVTTSGISSITNIFKDLETPTCIYDMQGRIVKQPISELSPGIYILQYKNKTIKILK